MLPSYKKVVFIKGTLLVSERARGLDLQMILKFHQLFMFRILKMSGNKINPKK